MLVLFTYLTVGYKCHDFGTMDLGSVMMLDAFSFSSNGKATMTRKNGLTFLPQREKLSEQDAACINSLYATVAGASWQQKSFY